MGVVLTTGLLCVLFDQFSKWYLYKYYPTVMNINDGLLFGLSVRLNIFAWVVLLAVLVTLVVRQSRLETTKYQFSGEVLIIAGVLSNFIDRVIRGGIVDYLYIGQYVYFNIADVVILIGIIIICRKYVKLNF